MTTANRKPAHCSSRTAGTLPAILVLCALAAAFLFATISTADAGTVAESGRVDRTAACATDEPSVTRCVWDARHQGNGAGRSFVTEGEQVRYVTHRRAHWLATTAN